MKYIIDIPNDDVGRWIRGTPYGMKLLVPISIEDGKEYHIKTDISVQNYSELYQEEIEDEVWEFAWKIIDMDLSVYQKIFGGKGCPADYREAKAKYNEWLRKNHDGCKGCKYDYKSSGEEPCFSCKQNYLDKWEATE